MSSPDAPEKKSPHKITINDIGHQLQLARERIGLSTESIAAELRLTQSIVNSIENNPQESEVPPVYLCGYIKAYANYVNLSTELTQQIPSLLKISSGNLNKLPRTPINVHQLSVKDTKIKYLVYLGVLLLIVLMFSWWNSHNQSNTIVATTTTNQPPAVQSQAQPQTPYFSATTSQTPTNAAPAQTPTGQTHANPTVD